LRDTKSIIILDCPGHPFQYELAKKISVDQKDFVIHIHNPSQLGPKSNFEDSNNFKIETVNKKISRNHFIRLFDELVFSFLLIKKIVSLNPKSILSSNNPIIPQFFLWLYCQINNVKFTYWLQDIYGIAVSKILNRQKNILAKPVSAFFHFLEFFILKRSNHVITISPDFDNILIDKGVNVNNISCIPNWAPIEDLPVLDKENEFSIKNQINKSFNIIYSGTLGFKHNPDVLISISQFITDNDLDIKLVIISEGPTVEYVKKQIIEKDLLDTIIFLPFQDFDIFPQVLAAADISLVMLEKDAGEFCVPSKLLSILCSKRIPLIFVPKENLSARIVSKNNCGVSVENESQLLDAVTDIYNNYENYTNMKNNARDYAEDNFKIDQISKKFLKIIK
tara:strand:- start:8582 stop:9760 length:1179 start_codon:yes stop_codon:yes gene_type:complete